MQPRDSVVGPLQHRAARAALNVAVTTHCWTSFAACGSGRPHQSYIQVPSRPSLLQEKRFTEKRCRPAHSLGMLRNGFWEGESGCVLTEHDDCCLAVVRCRHAQRAWDSCRRGCPRLVAVSCRCPHGTGCGHQVCVSSNLLCSGATITCDSGLCAICLLAIGHDYAYTGHRPDFIACQALPQL